MSRLFREMQEAEKHSVKQPATNAALAALLMTAFGEDAQIAHPTSRLEVGRSIALRAKMRPVLLASDGEGSTQGALEAYRAVRTKLARFQAAQGIRSVVVSSAGMGEGKTLSTLNLGISLAQLQTQHVLLVDGDIRTAGLSTLTGASGAPGLSEVLTGQATFEAALVATDISKLYVVGAGEVTTAASDQFAGARWREFVGWCHETFDIVIVDSPPILGLADFDLISAACDGVLMIVRAGKTNREALAETVEHLHGKKLLGVILNGMQTQPSNYNGYYYYSRGKGRTVR